MGQLLLKIQIINEYGRVLTVVQVPLNVQTFLMHTFDQANCIKLDETNLMIGYKFEPFVQEII